MKNYLFQGDPHGSLDFARDVAVLAAEHDAEIMCVGDWGFVWPRRDKKWRLHEAPTNYLDELSKELALAGEKFAKPPVVMRFIDGNHDHHKWLGKIVDNALNELRPFEALGGIEVAPNVIYQARGSTHEDEDGTRFLFFGGAASIDHARRVKNISIWDEEVPSEVEFERARSHDGPFHVLVTHDAHDYPPGFEPKGDPDFRVRSAKCMDMIRRLSDKYQPGLHVHGHWHHRYSTMRGTTKVVGLNCNYAKLSDAVMLWSREP